MTQTFEYAVLYSLVRPEEVSNVIAWRYRSSRHPLEAVMFSGRHRTWVFAPSAAGTALFDELYEDRIVVVDRATAERVAMERIGVPLPSEEEIDRICLAKSPSINDRV
jgi:hypothetical protein